MTNPVYECSIAHRDCLNLMEKVARLPGDTSSITMLLAQVASNITRKHEDLRLQSMNRFED